MYDYYSLEPGNQKLRPIQETPIDRLIFAGDYTKQPYFAAMDEQLIRYESSRTYIVVLRQMLG